MRRTDRRPPTTAVDPVRLLHAGTSSGELLKVYARRTRPGSREGAAAWYRLRPRLDAATATATASLPLRWTRTRLLGATLAAALVLLMVVKTTSNGERHDFAHDAARTIESPGGDEGDRRGQRGSGSGPGGATGSVNPGGTEGSSGANGIGETAIGDGLFVCPSFAG